ILPGGPSLGPRERATGAPGGPSARRTCSGTGGPTCRACGKGKTWRATQQGGTILTPPHLAARGRPARRFPCPTACHLPETIKGQRARAGRYSQSRKEPAMSSLLKWAIAFLVIAIIAALFGFGGIAEGSAEIARVLFFLFLAVCAVLFILGLTVFKKVT